MFWLTDSSFSASAGKRYAFFAGFLYKVRQERHNGTNRQVEIWDHSPLLPPKMPHPSVPPRISATLLSTSTSKKTLPCNKCNLKTANGIRVAFCNVLVSPNHDKLQLFTRKTNRDKTPARNTENLPGSLGGGSDTLQTEP